MMWLSLCQYNILCQIKKSVEKAGRQFSFTGILLFLLCESELRCSRKPRDVIKLASRFGHVRRFGGVVQKYLDVLCCFIVEMFLQQHDAQQVFEFGHMMLTIDLQSTPSA